MSRVFGRALATGVLLCAALTARALVHHHHHHRQMHNVMNPFLGNSRGGTDPNEYIRQNVQNGPPLQPIEQRSYEYDGWECSYRYVPAGPRASPHTPALLLLHPIGVGMSSWFYEPLIRAVQRAHPDAHPEIFAPDFIGCGASAEWDPQKRGLFIPLDYARQCEALWRAAIGKECAVLAQGNLAPVGVRLAARQADAWDGPRAIHSLLLCSPPTWREIAADSDARQVRAAYDAWSSAFGQVAYDILRQPACIRFFSNLFLFADGIKNAEDVWVRTAAREAAAKYGARWPVFALNAGLVSARGLYDELLTLTQPCVILEGEKDGFRSAQRDGYVSTVPSCRRVVVEDALNVLPWEAADTVADALLRFSFSDYYSAVPNTFVVPGSFT